MVLEIELSKTYQYRKVMKPMLERKRRARINKCLDELKDIMVECLTQDGEHITRLEKADILELTVEHMKKLKQQKQLRISQDPKMSVAESFRAGYVHAANEVSKALASVPGVSVDLGTHLMGHLGRRLSYLQVVVPTAQQKPPALSQHLPNFTTESSTISTPNYIVDNSRIIPIITISPSPSDCSSDTERSNSPTPSDSSSVWRPW